SRAAFTNYGELGREDGSRGTCLVGEAERIAKPTDCGDQTRIAVRQRLVDAVIVFILRHKPRTSLFQFGAPNQLSSADAINRAHLVWICRARPKFGVNSGPCIRATDGGLAPVSEEARVSLSPREPSASGPGSR